MTYKRARSWLGIYFLVATSLIGCYLLLFAGPVFLPLTESEAADCFKIIIPVFIGQLTLIFQWMGGNVDHDLDDQMCPIPSWAIVTPPIIVVVIVAVASIVLVKANAVDSKLHTSPQTFKAALTFAVAMLNATTIYLTPRLFPIRRNGHVDPSNRKGSRVRR